MKSLLISAVVALAAVFPLAGAGSTAWAGPDVDAVAASAPRSAPWWRDAVDDPQLLALLQRVQDSKPSLEEIQSRLKRVDFHSEASTLSEGRAWLDVAIVERYANYRMGTEVSLLIQAENDAAAADAFRAASYRAAGQIDAAGEQHLLLYYQRMHRLNEGQSTARVEIARYLSEIGVLLGGEAPSFDLSDKAYSQVTVRKPELAGMPLGLVRQGARVAAAEQALQRQIASDQSAGATIDAAWKGLTLSDLFRPLSEGDKNAPADLGAVMAALAREDAGTGDILGVKLDSKADTLSVAIAGRLASPGSKAGALDAAASDYRTALKEALDETGARIHRAREAEADLQKARKKESDTWDKVPAVVARVLQRQASVLDLAEVRRDAFVAQLEAARAAANAARINGELLTFLYPR